MDVSFAHVASYPATYYTYLQAKMDAHMVYDTLFGDVKSIFDEGHVGGHRIRREMLAKGGTVLPRDIMRNVLATNGHVDGKGHGDVIGHGHVGMDGERMGQMVAEEFDRGMAALRGSLEQNGIL